MLLIIIGLVLFVLLVVVHELGHAIAARRNGVDVEEFGIGFPPRLYGRNYRGTFRLSRFFKELFVDTKNKKAGLKDPSKTLVTINLLPLGGFVKLKGEHDADTEPGSYGAAPLWAKTKIIMAGVVMNLLVAIAMFTLLALIGMPKIVDNQFTVASDTKVLRNDVLVGLVEPDSPAAQAGIELRDQLVSVSSEGTTVQINAGNALPDITKEFAGKSVVVIVERDGQMIEKSATLRSADEVEASKTTDNPKGYLGIVPTEYTVQRSTWSAPIVGVGITKQFAELTYKGLGAAIANVFKGEGKQASEQVSGPVGIFVLIKDGSRLGLSFILMIIAVISLTLAIMNALPIPALDGGRLFVTYLFRILKKPLTPSMEDKIHGTGFLLLMLLFVLITVIDVRRIF